MAKYKVAGDCVVDQERGCFIPNSAGNRDYREYQEWLEAGNVPDPADPPVPLTKEQRLLETQHELVSSLDWVIQYLIDQNVIKKADLPPELDALYESRKAIRNAP